MFKATHTIKALIAIGCILISSVSVWAAEINLIQSGTTSSNGNGVVTVDVTSVDMSKSFLIFQTRHSSNRPAGSTVRGELASATQLKFTRVTTDSSTINIQWYLVEYANGVAVQRGDTTQSSATKNVTLGTSLSAASSAFLLYSKTVGSTDSIYSEDDPMLGRITSSSNIQFKTDLANSNHAIHWQVVEFTDGSVNVQTGTNSITTQGQFSASNTLSNAVDLSKSFLLAGWMSGDREEDLDERMITAALPSDNSVTFTRTFAGSKDVDEIAFQVVEFSDATLVQRGEVTLASGETTRDITIDSVDPSKSIAFSTVQAGDGQNMGNVVYFSDDITGEGAYTLAINSATSLRVQRNSSNAASTVIWQVVSLPGTSDGDDDSSCIAADSTYPIVATGGMLIESDVRMNGNQISSGTKTANATVDTDGDVSYTSVPIPTLNPATFPTNSSTTDISHNNSPVNTSGEAYYRNVTVGNNQTLSFTGGGTYHLDTLTIGFLSKVRLSAGTYFVNNLDMQGVFSDIIIDSGPVIFHVGTQFNVPGIGADINDDGDVGDLQIYLHDGATINASGLIVELNAVIIGPNSGSIFFGEDFEFEGIVHTSSSVHISEDSTFKLSSAQQTEIDNIFICAASGSNLDHFEIDHDGSGINCLSEIITITTVDATGTEIEDYVGSITLDTQSGKGTWNLETGQGSFPATTDNGVATYTFDDDDNGVASFSLSYKEGSSSLDIDAWQTSDPSLRDDDSESALIFSPSGFTLTQSLLSNPPPLVINDPITHQTAGTDFPVHISAYGQTDTDPLCGVIEAYTGDKSLAFWFDYNNPGSGTLSPTIDSIGISSNEGGASTQIVTFTNGQASVTAKYKDVGEIQLHTKDDTIEGSTNQFVVKPATIVITDIKTNSGVNNPAANSATGDRFVAAGEAFNTIVEVRDAEGSRTPNFGNESTPEGIELIASSLVIPASGRNGSANNGFIENNSAFSAVSPPGTFSGNQFSWDEYGIIKLQASISDDDYLGAGEVTGPESGHVGRFYPASYSLQSSTVAAACNSFTYMDQPDLAISYNLEAHGTASNKLFNYDQVLLGSTGVSNPTLAVENNNQGVNLNGRLVVGTPNWINGGYSYSTLSATFSRASALDGPFASLSVGLSVNDSLDGRTINAQDMNAGTATNCTAVGDCNAKSLSGITQMFYGRMTVSNAFGPETRALDIQMNASYFDGSDFIVNTADNCTTYINSSATLSNYQDGLPAVTVMSPTTIVSLQSGQTLQTNPLLISAPGAPNTGSVDLTFDAPAWLEFNWLGTGNIDPTGTASFGHFRGHDKVIYWREVLN